MTIYPRTDLPLPKICLRTWVNPFREKIFAQKFTAHFAPPEKIFRLLQSVRPDFADVASLRKNVSSDLEDEDRLIAAAVLQDAVTKIAFRGVNDDLRRAFEFVGKPVEILHEDCKLLRQIGNVLARRKIYIGNRIHLSGEFVQSPIELFGTAADGIGNLLERNACVLHEFQIVDSIVREIFNAGEIILHDGFVNVDDCAEIFNCLGNLHGI